MDAVARWRPRDRAGLFNEVGAARGLANAIVEKDFWVCWTLKRLFAPGAAPPGLVFKGGTSLSKAYGAIRRFSEDIDLSLDRAALGYGGDRDPERAASAKQAGRLIEALVRDVQAHIAGPFVTALSAAIAAELGPAGTGWSLTVDPADPQTVLFRYPASLGGRDYAGLAYVNPVVRLELGARGDPWPAERRTVTPYAAEAYPELFADPACTVTVLAVERTFWEKATILHAEHHRPAEKAAGDRLSRHYADLAMLARSRYTEAALARIDLLEAVARHKALFFRAGWARYEEARPGSLRLLPPRGPARRAGGGLREDAPDVLRAAAPLPGAAGGDRAPGAEDQRAAWVTMAIAVWPPGSGGCRSIPNGIRAQGLAMCRSFGARWPPGFPTGRDRLLTQTPGGSPEPLQK